MRCSTAMRRLMLAVCLLLAMVGATPGWWCSDCHVAAAVVQWKNPGAGGKWEVADNWNPAQVPSSQDEVLLPASETLYTVFIGGFNTQLPLEQLLGVAEAGNLTIGTFATLDLLGQLTVTDRLTSAGSINLFYVYRPLGSSSSLLTAQSMEFLPGALFSGLGDVVCPTVRFQNETTLAVRVPPFVDPSRVTSLTQLNFNGSVYLSEGTRTRVWVANASDAKGFGQLQTTFLSMAGQLEIVQINGQTLDTSVPLLTWQSSSRAFSNVTFLNRTDLDTLECAKAIARGPLCPPNLAPVDEGDERYPCTSRYDCTGGACGFDGFCGGCSDGVQNLDEADVDCGQFCGGCGAWLKCGNTDDCFPGLQCTVVEDTLAVPSYYRPTIGTSRCLGCFDKMLNFDETRIDCGGSFCSPCPAIGDPCGSDLECGLIEKSFNETYRIACARVNNTCVQDPTCYDGIRNGQETDVDCGGPLCPACAAGKTCARNADCSIECGPGEEAICQCGYLTRCNTTTTTCEHIHSCQRANHGNAPSDGSPRPAGNLPPARGCHDYLSGGLMVLLGGGLQCNDYCPFGWTGYPQCSVPLCEPVASNLDLLNQVPLCNDHGSCQLLDVVPECVCDSGYTGVACHLPSCPNDCSRRGNCTMTSGGGACQCTVPGWGGIDCNVPNCPSDCSGHGRCFSGTGGLPQCRCDSGFSGDDCSVSPCPSCGNTCAYCNYAGKCTLATSCQCSDLHAGTRCQFRLCERSMRALFVQARILFEHDDTVNAVDAFLDSPLLTDLLQQLALAADISPGDICLTDVQSQPHNTRSMQSSTLYPVFSLNPEAANPYACNATCPEALLAWSTLQSVFLNQSQSQPDYPFDQVFELDLVELPTSPNCTLGCNEPQGLCWFSECICGDVWAGLDCSIPSCPGDPDCSNNGNCTAALQCECKANWTGTACEIGLCPLNCSASLDQGFCDTSSAEPFCQCAAGWQEPDCSTRVPSPDDSSSRWNWYAWATLGCICGALALILLIIIFPPTRNLLISEEGHRVDKLRRVTRNTEASSDAVDPAVADDSSSTTSATPDSHPFVTSNDW